MTEGENRKTSTKPAGPSCPICGTPAADGVRPFCSRRCADIDLNRWLTGVYRIETEEGPGEPQNLPEQPEKPPE